MFNLLSPSGLFVIIKTALVYSSHSMIFQLFLFSFSISGRNCIGPKVNGMGFRRGIFIFPPNLDGLVSLSRDQPQPRPIKGAAKDPAFGAQTAGLHGRLGSLKIVARSGVPKVHAAIVAPTKHDPIFIDGKCIDDGIVSLKSLHKFTVWKFPSSNAIR